MPEVLLRVVAGSACDQAVAALSTHGRISPGRKPDERVIAISPRVPTVRSTMEITAALAIRVMDHAAPRQRPDRQQSAPVRTGSQPKSGEEREPQAA